MLPGTLLEPSHEHVAPSAPYSTARTAARPFVEPMSHESDGMNGLPSAVWSFGRPHTPMCTSPRAMRKPPIRIRVIGTPLPSLAELVVQIPRVADDRVG